MIGNRRGAFGIRHLIDRVCPLQGFAEEESQRCRTMADRTDTKFPLVEQVHLIGADLFRPKLIRRTAEMFCERLYNFQVAVHGSLRVITTLEFFPHQFAKLGHRDLLVTHKILPSKCGCYPDHHAQRPPPRRLRSNGVVAAMASTTVGSVYPSRLHATNRSVRTHSGGPSAPVDSGNRSTPRRLFRLCRSRSVRLRPIFSLVPDAFRRRT